MRGQLHTPTKPAGLENYFQLRQPLLDPRMKDETRPFDEDLVATAEVAKSRLRQHGVSYL